LTFSPCFYLLLPRIDKDVRVPFRLQEMPSWAIFSRTRKQNRQITAVVFLFSPAWACFRCKQTTISKDATVQHQCSKFDWYSTLDELRFALS